MAETPTANQAVCWVVQGEAALQMVQVFVFCSFVATGRRRDRRRGGAKGVPSVSSKMLWKASLADSFPYHYLIPIIRTWSNTIVLSETLIIFVTLKGNWSFHLILTSFNHLSWRFYFIFISACKCIARGYLHNPLENYAMRNLEIFVHVSVYSSFFL